MFFIKDLVTWVCFSSVGVQVLSSRGSAAEMESPVFGCFFLKTDIERENIKAAVHVCL